MMDLITLAILFGVSGVVILVTVIILTINKKVSRNSEVNVNKDSANLEKFAEIKSQAKAVLINRSERLLVEQTVGGGFKFAIGFWFGTFFMIVISFMLMGALGVTVASLILGDFNVNTDNMVTPEWRVR